MGQKLSTYAPIELLVLVNGIRITGFTDTDILTIDRDTPRWSKQTGVMDETARANSAVTGAKVTLQIMQSSYANDLLTQLHKNDAENPADGNTMSLVITDKTGTTNFVSTEAWILDLPQVQFTNGLETRSWEIDCANSKEHVGGNAVSLGVVGAFASGIESVTGVNIPTV